MQITILEHNLNTGLAKIKFEHNNVTHVENYDLKLVVPGTSMVLKAYGLDFTEEMQQRVIDKLTMQVQNEIETGILHNPI